MNRKQVVSLIAAVVTAGPLGGAARADQAPSLTIEQKIEALDQEIRILKRQRENDEEAAAAKAKDAAVVTAGKDGFSLKSGDGNFQLKLRGYAQFDARFFLDDSLNANDTFVARRVRPIIEGTVYKDFAFRIMPDFGGGNVALYDAYVDWKHWPALQLRAGKFKPPVGLERLQSATDTAFVERALPTQLVPTRDVGVQVFGELWDGVAGYAAGIFNGTSDGGNGDLDADHGKDVVARVFVQPFKKTDIEPLQGLGVGISASFGDETGTTNSPALPSFRSAGQQRFFRYRSDGTTAGTVLADGQHKRYSPQGYWYWGPVGLLAEYVVSSQDVNRNGATAGLDHRAWQVTGSYVLTGENASFKGVTPKKPFDLKNGGWGAWEIVGRYNELDVDDEAFTTFASATSSATEARGWAVGLNWYLNKNIKFAVDFEETSYAGGATTVDRQTEQLVFTRAQVSF